jgi:hypothetical protein
MEWPLPLVKETGNSVLLGLRVHIVPVLLKPLTVRLGLLKVELASIDDLGEVNLRSDSLDDLSILIELFDRVFHLLLLLIGDQVALVQQDNVCKLNLVAHQLEDGSVVSLVHVVEDLRCNLPRVEICVEVAAVHHCHAGVQLRQLLQLCCGLRNTWVQQGKIKSECFCDLHWL